MNAARLYTPELLGLAVDLADFPPIETLPLHGEARSPTCGSTLAVDIALDDEGRICQLGMRVRACAVGQAAASLFARGARGRNLSELIDAHERISAWLTNENATVDPAALWPGFDCLAPARRFTARHSAILLSWKASILALSSAPSAS